MWSEVQSAAAQGEGDTHDEATVLIEKPNEEGDGNINEIKGVNQ
jgi:hypothetical protein